MKELRCKRDDATNFFFFFGCNHSKQKFLGQGLNSSHNSDNARSLTTLPPGNSTANFIWKGRNRFSLTCLLTVHNLFIHCVRILNQGLEGLDHLQRKHPDTRSHWQLDTRGSTLLCRDHWTTWLGGCRDAPPCLKSCYSSSNVYVENDNVTPPYTAAQTRLWGGCSQVVRLVRDWIWTLSQYRTESVPVRKAPNIQVYTSNLSFISTKPPTSAHRKLQHLYTHSLQPRCLHLKISLKLTKRIKKQHLFDALLMASLKLVSLMFLSVTLKNQCWALIPNCMCLF